MNHLRNVVTTLFALAAFTTSLAFAQQVTSEPTATVTAVNTLTIDAGSTVSLAPAVGSDVTDATTQLSFSTNDGSTYQITVVASAWEFTPSVALNVANTYPVLSFESATATAGTAVVTSADLINTANTAAAAAPVVTGIVNATGTADVTLGASVSQTVVSGAYAATLTYTFATP